MKTLIIILSIGSTIIYINTICGIHSSKVKDYQQKQKDEIIILKMQQQKHLVAVYLDEYYKLVNVLEKCKKCQASYFVDENKNLFIEE